LIDPVAELCLEVTIVEVEYDEVMVGEENMLNDQATSYYGEEEYETEMEKS
jgi:hypothetical protein